MLFNEWIEVSGNSDADVYELVQAVYSEVVAEGGHEGHVSAAKWFKKNAAEVQAMARLLRVAKNDKRELELALAAQQQECAKIDRERARAQERGGSLELELANVKGDLGQAHRERETLKEHLSTEMRRAQVAEGKLGTVVEAFKILRGEQ